MSREELLCRFTALPDTFPQTKRHAAELTAGTGHDRFDFTIGLMIGGLAHCPAPGTARPEESSRATSKQNDLRRMSND